MTMPTAQKSSTSADTAHGATRPLFAQAPAQSLATGPLVVAHVRSAFTYMVNPAALECRRGRIVPRPAKALHVPGLCGNSAAPDNRGLGMVNALTAYGYRMIPHDIAVTAFGASHVGDVSTYLRRWQCVDAAGTSATHYTDAWERPRQLGHLTLWDRDIDGRDEWLIEQLYRLMGTDQLAPEQVRIAVEPIINDCMRISEQPRNPDASVRMMAERLRHLPDEHVPARWRRYLINDGEGNHASA